MANENPDKKAAFLDELTEDARYMIKRNNEKRFMYSTGFFLDPVTTLMIFCFNGILWWALFSSHSFPSGFDIFLLIYAVTGPFVTMYAAGMRLVLTKAKTTAGRVIFVCQVVVQVSSAILAFAVIYRVRGLVDGNTATNDPITCLYFSIVTWTTLGYGDVKPSIDVRLFAAAESFLGYVAMAALIGLFAVYVRYVFLPEKTINAEGEYYKESR